MPAEFRPQTPVMPQQSAPADASSPLPKPGLTGASPEAAAQVLRMLESMRAGMPRTTGKQAVSEKDTQPPRETSPQSALSKVGMRASKAAGQVFGQNVADWGARLFGGDGSHDSGDMFDPENFTSGNSNGGAKTPRDQILERTLKMLPTMLKIDIKGFNKHYPGMGDYVDHPPTVLRSNLQNLAVALMFGATKPELKKLMPVLERIYQRIAYIEQNSKAGQVATRPCKDLNRKLGFEMADHPMVFPIGA